MVSIRGLKKSFGEHEVLKGIDLDIEPGQLICFIGRSGCGKSTLLRTLNGLEVLDEGEIEIAGHSLSRKSKTDPLDDKFEKKAQALRKHCGMVFQDFRLFPHMSLLENVVLAQTVGQKIPRDEAIAKSEALLGKVGLQAHKDKMPLQLSGGQSQRGAIARALALSPAVMLYDEPTSALDPELVDEVLSVMKALDQEGMTQLAVTHEMRFARDASDYVVYMEEGSIVEIGAPDVLFSSPKDDRTRQFLRKFL
ncbi:MAG: amino acid ABC transporter ATP-binding protein [Cryobacterium sp.]|nr:amino acid ABC transporter ATP-binding protein [Oligoflexia bacterium]